MPEYRRVYLPGTTLFLTLVTHKRAPLFAADENVALLRRAVSAVKSEMPFEVDGAVILPDHLHFIWTLTPADAAYPKRVGRLKALFTKFLREGDGVSRRISESRARRGESDVWQRRFWEHTIRDEEDFQRHLDYMHYNPVRHGLASCPHKWRASSFHSWVRRGAYPADWCCRCHGRRGAAPDFAEISAAGE